MTARRQARAKPALVTDSADSGDLPAPFVIGRCVEVWADPVLDHEVPRTVARIGSAKRRFSTAHRAWLEAHGISERDGFHVIPAGAPWSAGDKGAADRLTRNGYRLDDLPALAAEDLFASVLGGGALTRAYRRRTRPPDRGPQDH